MSDGNINAVELFGGISRFEVDFLIDDGINGDGGFSSLSVSDDELSLSSSDGYQTVYRLESTLHGLMH